MEDRMGWFVSHKDGPSLEVSADKASEFIDLFGKKHRDDITEAIIEGERKMVSHIARKMASRHGHRRKQTRRKTK